MKTLTPTNLIAVEVQKDATDIRINEFGTFIFYQDNGKRAYHLDFFASEIIGEVTDTEISFDVELPNKNFVGRTVYKDFNNPESGFFETKEKSFRSLLRFNEIYFKNPMGKTPNILRDSENSWTSEQYKEWQSYESKLIKGKLIILKQK